MEMRKLTPFAKPHKVLFGLGERINNRFIYKYVPIDTAISCLRNNTIRFSQPNQWKDPYESLYYTANYKNVMKRDSFGRRLYACCLTTIKDCEAAWRMYTEDEKSKPCVQFKIRIGPFREFVESCLRKESGTVYEGLANYDLQEEEIFNLHKRQSPKYDMFFKNFGLEQYLNLMLLKRRFYKYEGEIRYLIQSDNFDYKDAYHDVKIPWSYCLHSVRLPPSCNDEMQKMLQDALDDNLSLCKTDFQDCQCKCVTCDGNTLFKRLKPIVIE